MCCLHIGIVRHAPFYFAANGNSGFCAETEFLRPIDDRIRAGLDSDLIKPSVAGFGQGLNEIQEAAIAFFPIVKGEVPDLDRWDALILFTRCYRSAFQRGDADGDFEGRSGRVG